MKKVFDKVQDKLGGNQGGPGDQQPHGGPGGGQHPPGQQHPQHPGPGGQHPPGQHPPGQQQQQHPPQQQQQQHQQQGQKHPLPPGRMVPHQAPDHFPQQPGLKPVTPQPGQHQGPGHMPPKVKEVEYLGAMQFYHPKGHKHQTLRDLGFSSVLDGKILWTFGDTLMGTPGNARICAQDSVGIGSTTHPMCTLDVSVPPDGNLVQNWIKINQEEKANGGYTCFAFGGTNIVEIAPNKGIVYYLKNHRPGGKDHILGAGVATVHMEGNQPVSQRVGEKLWTEAEPMWGDIGVTLNGQDGHIYVYGHGPGNDKEIHTRVYLCRVKAHEATDVSKYEYWLNDKREWTKQRLTMHGQNGTLQLTKEQPVFGWMTMNQSAPFWNNYFNKWMVLHCNSWGYSDVICRTADKLEGPWAEHGVVAATLPEGQGDGFRYCATGHPEFDPSGKTILVTWTRQNMIMGARIHWE